MNDHVIMLLRCEGQALTEVALLVARGRDARHAMDRAALALHVHPALCPELLLFGAADTHFLPGDILVGGVVTARVVEGREARAGDYRGLTLTLR